MPPVPGDPAAVSGPPEPEHMVCMEYDPACSRYSVESGGVPDVDYAARRDFLRQRKLRQAGGLLAGVLVVCAVATGFFGTGPIDEWGLAESGAVTRGQAAVPSQAAAVRAGSSAPPRSAGLAGGALAERTVVSKEIAHMMRAVTSAQELVEGPQPGMKAPLPGWEADNKQQRRAESRKRLNIKHVKHVREAETPVASRPTRSGATGQAVGGAAREQAAGDASGGSAKGGPGDAQAPKISPALSKELTNVISKIVAKVAAKQAKQGKLVAAPAAPAPAPAGAVVEATPLNNFIPSAVLRTKNATRATVREIGRDVGLKYRRSPLTYLAWFTAALCVIATMLISTTLILRHLECYQNPDTQKYVVRILFMAPIYAMDSLLALTFVGWATTYIDVFRDIYEAFTIYNFFKLLVVLLGGEKAVIDMLAAKPQMPLVFPLHWMEPWEMGAELFYGCKYGALQYVLVKPTCAVIMFVSGAAGLYGSHTFSLARLHFYVFFLSSTSQVWALYCLVTFYVALSEELRPHNPLPKFVIVKAVVFFCFWQGMVLGALAYWGYIQVGAPPRFETFVVFLRLVRGEGRGVST
jgi:hypothetical protein